VVGTRDDMFAWRVLGIAMHPIGLEHGQRVREFCDH